MAPTDPRPRDADALDRMLTALSHPTRRRVLASLAERTPGATVEATPASIHPDGEATEGFAIELYHRHLPKLDETGYVDWDRETDAVTRGARFDEIRFLLDLLVEAPVDDPGD